MAMRVTPSQTIGPFFAYGLTPEQYGYPFAGIAGPRIAGDDVPGERIRVVGRVLDGAGEPVDDAMIEVWQADGEGRYAHPADGRGSNLGFRGFGRAGTGTDPERRFAFETVKPGPVDGAQAPHLNLILFMRGLLLHLHTRLYFADEAAANGRDPVLAALPPERRRTLVAAREETPAGPVYRFDIRMQGEDETVFFDV
jgi:protocatechuate 3,4-dioxygenase, alpha subunit